MANNYLLELEAIQRFMKKTVGLNSYRLSEAKPKVARPIILWETPDRKKGMRLSQYSYVMNVRQYGRLFTTNLDTMNDYQQQIIDGLEEINNTLPVVLNTVTIGHLKNVEVEFDNNNDLDVAFNIRYEVTYCKTKPVDPPAATKVITKVIVDP